MYGGGRETVARGETEAKGEEEERKVWYPGMWTEVTSINFFRGVRWTC